MSEIITLGELLRTDPMQVIKHGGLSVARDCGVVPYPGPNADNGMAMIFTAPETFRKATAKQILSDIYLKSRNLPKDPFPDEKAGATAASVIMTEEGVTVRSAGDSIVLRLVMMALYEC
jgi:hypothetical protein